MSALDADAVAIVAALLRVTRWGALATTDAAARPVASQVAFALLPGSTALCLHLSELAAHTRNLFDRPACSLSVSEPDDQRDDPQTLARLTLTGVAQRLLPGTAECDEARRIYLARLPEAAERFGFGDFHLLRVDLHAGHYVGGFARAWRLDAAQLGDVMACASGAID